MFKKKLLIPIVAVVVVVAVGIFLFTKSFFTSPVLLDETVTLTSYSYERWFYLSLKQGDRLSIQVSVTGEPIDFQVGREQPTEILIDKEDVLSVNEQLVIPSGGNYFFYVGTMGDHATVHLKVTRIES
jgi:hypothetical protein